MDGEDSPVLHLGLDVDVFLGWIDPGFDWLCRRLWFLSDEAFRVSFEGAIQGVLAGGVDCVGQAVMDLIGRHETDAGMVMLAVIPIEEIAAEGLGILDATEALWKLRLVFHGFEVALRERIII
jgi:hypothetical protein